MPVERFAPGAPAAAIGSGLVASSFQYYLTGDESLRVIVTPLRLPAGTIELAWRSWRQSDRQVVLTRQSIPAGVIFPIASTTEYPLNAGALLNLRVGVGSTAVQYGLVWVRVQLILGAGTSANVIGTLAQGFVSTQNDLGWPGSPIEKQDQAAGFLVSEPGVLGGASVLWTVSAGQRYRVICGRFSYAASAVAGNRNGFVAVLDPAGNYVYAGENSVAFGAGVTQAFSFAAGHSPSADGAASNFHLPFPTDLELMTGWQVQVSASGAQAGDGISGPILVYRTRVDG